MQLLQQARRRLLRQQQPRKRFSKCMKRDKAKRTRCNQAVLLRRLGGSRSAAGPPTPSPTPAAAPQKIDKLVGNEKTNMTDLQRLCRGWSAAAAAVERSAAATTVATGAEVYRLV